MRARKGRREGRRITHLFRANWNREVRVVVRVTLAGGFEETGGTRFASVATAVAETPDGRRDAPLYITHTHTHTHARRLQRERRE